MLVAKFDVDKKLRERYNKLRNYREYIKRSNLGSTMVIHTSRQNIEDSCVFKRMYICFGTLKMNWQLGVDQFEV